MSSKDDRPRTVPRFGSFKPKPSPKPDSESGPGADTEQTPKPDCRESKNHRSHHKDSEREHRHSRRDRHSERPHAQGPRIIEAPRRDDKLPADDLFTFDKRGDPLIIRYGGNERSRVPSYRRIGRGIVLGSNGYLEIHRDGARDEFSIRSSRERGSAFRDRSLLAQAGRSTPKVFKKYAEQGPSLVTEEFISVEPSRKRKRGDDDEGCPGSDHENYRSIEGKAKPQEDSDSAFESDSDDVGSEGYYITFTKRKSIALSHIVKEHPENTQAWLDLIALQDDLFRENEDNEHIRTRDETKALADIRVSMFEKALPHTKSVEDREKVLIGLMREGGRIWTSQKLAKRWNEVTEQDPESFALWKSRMDFELYNISTFSYDEIKQRFIDRLRFLEGKWLCGDDSGTSQADLAEQAIYVFLRLTRFLHEAGFVDLAVGAWQAMLELHFARPTGIDMGRESAMSSLGEFWESEVPRLGEANAAGWRKFVEDGSMADLPDGKQPGSRVHPQTRDVYKAWAATERQQALEARMPAKTVDEGTEDDPYRVVMFPDIEQLLVLLPNHLVPQVRSRLLDAYLMFCGLPPAFGTGSLLQIAVTDPFVYGGSKDFEDRVKQAPEAPGIGTERTRKPPEFKQDGSHMVLSPDVMFSGSNWFSYLGSWRSLYPEHDEPIERSYVVTTIRQLVRLFGVEELGEYYLALEWLTDPSAAKKVARAVLKQYPPNLSLYHAYAMIEWANGNLETARQVLSAATSLHQGAEAPGQMLRNTWAWFELEAGQKTTALSRLCSETSVDDQLDGSAISFALILKAKSQASIILDYAISSGKTEDAFHYATSLALFSYLSPGDTSTDSKEPRSTDQGDITAAMTSINAFSAKLLTRDLGESSMHERFLQFAARLLYFHATHGLVLSSPPPIIPTNIRLVPSDQSTYAPNSSTS